MSVDGGNWGRLGTFYQLPKECWRQPWTVTGKRYGRVEFAMVLIWKLQQEMEGRFRRLSAEELLPAVSAGRECVARLYQKPSHPNPEEITAGFYLPAY